MIQRIVAEKMEVNVMLDISNFPWAECSISENRIIYQSDSLSLTRTRNDTGTHRYEFELVSIDMDMKVGRGIKAKLSAATDDVLLFTHPRLGYAQGVEPPSGLVVIGVGGFAGSKVVELTGNIGEWSLHAGDLIQFSNDTKVYEVAEDTGLIIGTETVKLTFPLRKSVSIGSLVVMNGVTWHLLSNGAIDVSMEASDNQDMEITLVAVERL